MGKLTRGQGRRVRGHEGRRAGGHEGKRGSAKVQIGAVLLCKGAKVRDSAQGETGDRMVCWGIIVGPHGPVFLTANR